MSVRLLAQRRARSIALVVALVGVASCCRGRAPLAPAMGVPLAGEAVGETRWKGMRVDYRVEFDPNALAQVVGVGQWLLMRTASGNLVQVDRSPWRVVDTLVLSPALTYLAVSGRDVVVGGLADGGVVEVDPGRLALRSLGRAPGEVRCIATGTAQDADELLVVWRDATLAHHVGVLAPGATMRRLGDLVLPDLDRASGDIQCSLDDDGQLWYGFDAGEWGGALGVFDLAARTSRLLPSVTQGVRGFVAGPGGELLLYGGTTGSYVATIDKGAVRSVYAERRTWTGLFGGTRTCSSGACRSRT